MRQWVLKGVLTSILIFLCFVALSFASKSPVDQNIVRTKLRKILIPFIENKGQVNSQVAYYAKTFGGTVFVTKDGKLVYNLPAEKGGVALREVFVGGEVKKVLGEERAKTKVSYFRGKDRKKWVSGLATYNYVNLGEVWKGIKLKVRAYGDNVEKLFYVEPGVEVGKIKVRLEGAKSIEITKDGRLKVITEKGEVYFTKPVAYQDVGGKRKYVEVSYRVEGNEYGFEVRGYDPKKELVIDPLLASTFLGGSDNDEVSAIAVDSWGNVYVAGLTKSSSFTL